MRLPPPKPRRRPALRLETLEARDVPAIVPFDATDVGVGTGAGQQQGPDVAMRPDGMGFVVVYQDATVNGTDIFAQRYDANWQATGSRIAVNTTTSGQQDHPSVGIDGSGNFVVAWRDVSGADGSGDGVYARRFLANGTAVDATDFPVNTITANDQDDPDVAVTSAGRIVIAYSSGAFGSSNIFVKSYTSVTGALTPAYAETQLTSGTGPDFADAAVAVDSTGNAVVTWDGTSSTLTDGSGYAVFFAKVSSAGFVTVTATQANTVTAGDQLLPDVAEDGSGNFVVVWSNGAGDVSMRRFNAAGVPLVGESTVNTTTAGGQLDGHVSAAPDGRYVVTWTGDNGGAPNKDAFYKEYSSIATTPSVLIPETVVNTGSGSGDGTDQLNVIPAVNAAGDFVIAFESGATGTFDIDLRRFAEDANIAFGAATSSGAESSNASVAVTRTGAQYVLANTTSTVVVSDAGTGTATAGSDYTAFGGTLTFSATPNLSSGTQTQAQAITVVNDTADEPDETINLSLGSVTGGSPGTPTTHAYTIQDDDPSPTISVSSPSVTEGNGGTVTLTFAVTLSAASGNTITANYATADGTATTADGDYVATSGTLTFAPGQTSKTVNVTVNGDTKFEGTETFLLNVTGATNTSNATASGTGTILDDETAPTVSLSVSPASVAEAAGTSTVTATLSAASGVTTTVNLTLGGSATLNTDYTISSTTITIPAGSTTGTATVTAVQDTRDEVNETVVVGIATATNATPTGGAQTITVIDDDPNPQANNQSVTTDQGLATAITLTGSEGSSPPLSLTYTVTVNPAHGTLSGTAPNLTYTPNAGYSGPDNFQFTVSNGANTSAPATVSITVTPAPAVSIADATVTEGDGGTVTATFTVTLSNASGQTVSLNYATANNTAVAGSDYTATSGTLTFAPGQTSKTISVTVGGDTLFEGNETFFVNLSSLSYGTFADNQGVGTIADDDAPASLTVVSGNNQSTVVSTAFAAPLVAVAKNAAGNPVQGVTVTFAPPGAGASVTFATPAPVSNASGQVSTGTATANATAGGPYTVTATATGGTAPATSFSLTNLPPTNFSINDISVTEGDSGTKLVTFTVTASPVNNVSTSTINYATADGTATTADGDYVATSGTLTFAPGVSTQTFTVTVNGDAKFEADETFFVNLSGATNAGISDGQGVGTITNDDTAPTLIVNDVTAAEGDSGTTAFTFTVTQSAVSGATTTVNYATADGTATAGTDYTATSGTLTFAPGQTTKTVTVLVNGDAVYETDQTFVVNLSAPTNATIADGQGVGTLTNDDAAPTLAINDVSASESAGTITFTITRTGATEVPISVDYATADGTAVSTAGGPGTPDYTTTTGTATFAPSLAATATQTITVAIADDSVYEAAEQFAVNLSSPTGATIADAQGIATILDNDAAPTLTINDVTAAEGAGVATFTVTLAGATAMPIAVNFATADGTAVSTAGGPGTPDYAATSGTLTFSPSAAGTQTLTIAVPLVGDATNEPTEQFAVNLSGPTNGATIADAQGIATITDDDAVPSLAVFDVTQAEDNAGAAAFAFTVALSAASGQSISVSYGTADGTATAGSDYTATSGTLTFAPGETTKTVNVQVNGDTVHEADETFFVNLSGATNAVIADGQGIGTITNDDAAPTLAINDVSVSEGGGTITFTVTRTGATEVPITVDYATADGTAVATAGGPGTPDFTAASGTVNFAPSLAATATQTFTVALADDAVYEAAEQFAANLTGATGATIADGQGIGTITNDDAAPTLAINDVTVSEGGTATFTVTLTGATALPIAVNFATADGTAVATAGGPGTPDYTTTSGTLTFNPSASGTQTLTIGVPLVNDTTNEAAEQFALNLSGPTNGATISDAQGIATVTDDDAAPTLSIDDVTHAEGNAGTTTYSFTVSLSAASAQAVTVNYATADGSALAGTDYAAASGSLTFAPGQTTRTVTVLVNGDTTFEADQTFAVNLSGPTNATIAAGTGVGTITNDDAAPTLAINSPTVSEAAGTLTFTVTRTGATEVPISVGYATADGTAVATAGGPGTPDYTAASGTLTFAPSLAATATQTFTVPIANDAVYEAVEQFTATLTNPAGATTATGTGTATITDDDTAPTLSIGDLSVGEGGTATFTVTLTGATALPIAVDYATADGTATATPSATPGTPDYVTSSGTLTFNPSAAGTQTLTITVPLVNDTTNEPAEQFAVNLTNPTNGAAITDAQGIATVTDDDAPPALSVNSPSAAETNAGTTTLTFTVTLSAASALPVTVTVTTADGTATTADTDYQPATGVLTFLPGETTKTFDVTVNGDTKFEADETVLVNLTAPGNATVAAGTGTGTIANDDAAPTVTLSLAGSPFAEAGGTATVTATLSNPSSLPVTVTLGFTGTAATTDYSASATSIVIPANSLTGSITLTGQNDAADENPETVVVDIAAVTNGTESGAQQVTATIADDDLPVATAEAYTTTEGAALTIAAPGLLGNDNAAPGSVAELVGAGPANGTLTPLASGGFTYTPAADFNGTDSFQYRVRNAANETSNTVTVGLTVTAVNDAPSFTKGPDQVLPRKSGAQAVPGWATAVSRGPADEAGQALTFLVTTDNPGLFEVAPAIDPATGTLTYTPTKTGYGTATVTVRLMDNGGTANGGADTSAAQTFTITVNKHKTNSRPVDQNEFPLFAVAGGAGGPGTVAVYNGDGSVAYTVAPFGDGQGARGVIADPTGDGVADVVAGTGPGVPAKVVVIDGVTKKVVRTFTPFGDGFAGGVFVAAGDVDGDGFADVAVSADTSGGPRVVVYSGKTGATLADFYGIEDPDFRGGARIAFGDVNADGLADLVVSAGIGGGPRIAVYDGASIRAGQLPAHLTHDFYAFDAGLRDGAFLTAGDVNADGFDDLIFGGGPGGGPRVTALDSKSLFGGSGQFVVLTNYFSDDPALRAGARVAAKDFDGDRKADLVTAVPDGRASAVAVILGKDLGASGGKESADLDLFPGLLSGIFIG